MKKSLKTLISMSLALAILLTMVSVPVFASSEDIEIVYPKPASRNTWWHFPNVEGKENSYYFQYNDGQTIGEIPLVGADFSGAGIAKWSSAKFITTSFKVSGDNNMFGELVKLFVNGTVTGDGWTNRDSFSTITSLKGKDTSNLEVYTVVDLLNKKVYIWNMTEARVLEEHIAPEVFTYEGDLNKLQIAFMEGWENGDKSTYADDMFVSDYVQTRYYSEDVTLADVYYVKSISAPPASQHNWGTAFPKEEGKENSYRLVRDDGQTIADIPLVGTDIFGSKRAMWQAATYITTSFKVSGDNNVFGDFVRLIVNTSIAQSFNDNKNYSMITCLKGRDTSDLEVYAIVDLVNKKVYIYDMTNGGAFEYTYTGELTQLNIGFMEGWENGDLSTYDDDMIVNDLVHKIYYQYDIANTKLTINDLMPSPSYDMELSINGTTASATFKTFEVEPRLGVIAVYGAGETFKTALPVTVVKNESVSINAEQGDVVKSFFWDAATFTPLCRCIEKTVE